MSYQHHWVVVYDEDWGAFMVDAETTNVMLEEGDGTIYNKTTGHWEFAEEGSEELAEYQRLEEILAYQLTRLDLTAGIGQDTAMKTLPKEIVATRTFVYDVQDIVNSLIIDDENREASDVTLEEVVDYIQDQLVDDFGNLYNFNIHLSDEDGKEL